MPDSTATSSSNVFTIAAWTATGQSAPGSASLSNQTLPAITGSGDTLFMGVIPMLEPYGVAASGSAAHSSLAVLLPLVSSAAGSGAGSSSEPILRLEVEGAALPHRVATSSQRLPSIATDSQAIGASLHLAQSSAQLPALTGTGSGANDQFASSSVSLPSLTASGAATTVEIKTATSAQTLPIISAASSGGSERLGTSTANLPALTGDGDGASTGIIATGDSAAHSTFPSILFIDGSGEGLPARLAASSLALPAITGSGTAAGAGTAAEDSAASSSLSLLPLDISGYAVTGRLAQSNQILPTVQPESYAGSGTVGTSEQTLQAITGQGASGGIGFSFAYSSSELPVVTAAGAARSDSQAGSSADLLPIEAFSIAVTLRLTSSQFLPIIEASSAALTSRVGQSTAIVSLPIASGMAGSSMVAMSEVELPIITAESAAATLAGGTSILVLPVWLVSGTASGGQIAPAAGQAAAQGQGFALDTIGQALTEYAGANFNSYAWMGSVLLAANEDGLFVIGGATDNGVAIDATMSFPINPDDAQLRRLARLVVGYRNDGDLRLTVSVDGGQGYEYVLEETGRDECHPNRVRIGKGLKGRYWNMTVENIDGGDFAIDTLDADWEVLSRRVP